MWKKLVTPDHLSKLAVGDILIKYPFDRDPVDTLDLDDKEHLLRYQITSLKPITTTLSEIELSIPEDEIPQKLYISGMRVTGTLDNPPSLNKTSNELLSDKIWWVAEK